MDDLQAFPKADGGIRTHDPRFTTESLAVSARPAESSSGHQKRCNHRGRQAVSTEWRLILMSHNLTKLHRHQAALAA